MWSLISRINGPNVMGDIQSAPNKIRFNFKFKRVLKVFGVEPYNSSNI